MPRGKCHNKRYWFINEYDYDVMIEMIQYYENIEYNSLYPVCSSFKIYFLAYNHK